MNHRISQRRSALIQHTIASFIVVAVTTSLRAQDFEFDLARLDRLNVGASTDYEHIEHEGRRLLARYSEPQQRGRIHYVLLNAHAQGGLPYPKVARAHGEQTMALPLDPLTKMKAYIFWAGAIYVDARDAKGNAFETARREAVEPYLHGLNLAIRYNLPDDPPDLPSVDLFTFFGDRTSEEYLRHERRHREQMEARRLAKAQRDMISLRDRMKTQIVELYTMNPPATDELRQIATRIIGDHPLVAELVDRVERGIEERAERQRVGSAFAEHGTINDPRDSNQNPIGPQ